MCPILEHLIAAHSKEKPVSLLEAVPGLGDKGRISLED